MNIYLLLFLEFLKIGLFTFGGGYAMIPLIEEVCLKHDWLTKEQFLNMHGISEMTPGPIAINMATYVGSTQGGFLGSLLATIGVILPAFVIMLLISIFLKKYMKNKYVKGAINGIKFIAIALIASSALTLFIDVLFPYSTINGFTIVPQIEMIKLFVLVVAGYFILKIILKKKPGAIQIMLMSAFVGLIVGLL